MQGSECEVSQAAMIRIAIIGLGRMGRIHLEVVRQAASVLAAAVVEPDPTIRLGLEGQDMLVFDSLDELLQTDGFDAAIVAAPTVMHATVMEQLITAGVPILCEKPCGVSVPETEAIVRAAAQAGVPLQIGYWRRFVPELISLRDRIASGEFGALARVSCAQWDEQPPNDLFRRQSGGISIDMGVHDFDQMRWLTGQEIRRVVALASPTEPNRPRGDPDTAEILCSLSGGTIGHISLGRRFSPGDSCWAEVIGDKSYERSDFMWGHGGEKTFYRALSDQLDAFAATVRGEPLVGAGGEDAVYAMTVAERVHESLMSL